MSVSENSSVSSIHVVTEEPAWLIIYIPPGLTLTHCTSICMFRAIPTIRNYYEGWNFNSGNTAVETPCNGTK